MTKEELPFWKKRETNRAYWKGYDDGREWKIKGLRKYLNEIISTCESGEEMMERLENNKSLIDNPHFFHTLKSRFYYSKRTAKKIKEMIKKKRKNKAGKE